MNEWRLVSRVRWVQVGVLGLLIMVGAARATEAETSPTLALEPATRQALIDEMRSIQQASHEILEALVAGDHAGVRERAVHIHQSFILESALSAEQKTELQAKLPREFVALDGAFHRTAHKLAEAAGRADGELEQYYFGKLTSACVDCHAQYATHRFPAFQGTNLPPEAGGHHADGHQ